MNHIQRRGWLDEVARHTEVRNIAINQMRRCGRDRMKVSVITRGGLDNHELVKLRSQQMPY